MLATSRLTRTALPGTLALLLTVIGGFSTPVMAANQPAGTTDLSPTPVDITVAVTPNVALTFDDSGSMSFGYMPDSGRNLSCTDYTNYTKNSIYYNPIIPYDVPLDKDGNPFDVSKVQWPKVPYDGFNEALGFGSDTIDLSRKYHPTLEWNRDHSESENATSCSISSGAAYYYDPVSKKNVDISKSSDYQKQNFANWFSYYRTRSLMTKTAISRAFGKVSDIRLVWQTIWPNKHDVQVCDQWDRRNRCTHTSPQTITRDWSVAIDPINSVIDALVVDNKDGTTDDTVKKNFYTWLQKIESSDGTPDRAASVRVGEFFKKTIDDSNRLTNKNPYWNGKAQVDGGTSLSCRKNFHILVTDGYWNEDDSQVADVARNSETSISGGLPDGKTYTPKSANTYVYSNVDNGGDGINKKSLANIAFNYWATDLQPDIDNNVNPLWADTSALKEGKTNFTDDGVYFNPKNDPAVWQHLSQYIVTLGISGNRVFSNDPTVDDYKSLLDGSKSWGRAVGDTATALDDMWHAALNSRGGYFSASNPKTLEDSLSTILAGVLTGSASAVSGSLNTAVLADGALSYSTTYDSTDWSGSVSAVAVDPETAKPGDTKWTWKLPTPTSRTIFTGKRSSDGTVSGALFSWESLGADQQAYLETTPFSDPSAVDASTKGVQLAKDRLDWLRGVTTKESDGTFRKRGTNLLGAVINSQPKYVAYPADGYRNVFPKNADGTDAAENADGKSYEKFIEDHLDRPGTVYVGANDGMLHAFDASLKCNEVDKENKCTSYGPDVSDTAGTERWAYVPYSVYPNLSRLSDSAFTSRFVPTVDGTPVSRDVFFGEEWHTILVGGLRYGGRGVYALDITDPTSTATSKVLWEFTPNSPGNDPTKLDNGNNPSNLGYTYGQPNIARLSSGKWVVLIPSGYFPTCDKQFSPKPCPDIPAAANTRTSLFVVDAQTGTLIKEMRTPADVVSHGLTSPVVGDYDNDQVDDVAYAGDLDGNLWRFDLSDASVTATDASTGVLQLFKPETAGAQPITVMPRLFPDPKTRNLIVVFGTGKYLTAADNVTDTDTVVQSVYGIRDKADDDGNHVTTVSGKRSDDELVAQTMVEVTVTDPDTKQTETARGISNNEVPTDKGGWYFDLNVQDADSKPAARGERVVVTPAALFDTNRAIISTLIPRGDDACDPRRDGALLVIDAATGGSGTGLSYPGNPTWPTGTSDTTRVAGARVKNPPTSGSLPVATVVGGGKLMVPGVEFGSGDTFKIDDALWRRRSWRELNNDQ